MVESYTFVVLFLGSIIVGDQYLPSHYVSDAEERACISELIVMQHY